MANQIGHMRARIGSNMALVGPLILFWASAGQAQFSETPIKIFGYFQNSLVHQTEFPEQPLSNSFNLQQLNLFFQKDLAPSWRAFINVEMLNNFSSSRQWGSANLEEAWVRYRASEKFNLKIGLLTPTFNHFNEISNRTPVLPYIIRPLAYETSFEEFIATEEYAPARAFLQAYGFIPLHKSKFDYAIYLGNSPNLNTDRLKGQTGVDTTDTFLVGGRLGFRYEELKFGLSATHENVSGFPGQAVGIEPAFSFEEVPRTRVGLDLSYYYKNLSFESEYIQLAYDDDNPETHIDKKFYYLTLGYHASERWFAYVSYWHTREEHTLQMEVDGVDRIVLGIAKVEVPNVGVAFHLNDRITFKVQFAPVDLDQEFFDEDNTKVELEFNHFSVAASVFF